MSAAPATFYAPFRAPATPKGVVVSPWPSQRGGVSSWALEAWYGPAGGYWANGGFANADRMTWERAAILLVGGTGQRAFFRCTPEGFEPVVHPIEHSKARLARRASLWLDPTWFVAFDDGTGLVFRQKNFHLTMAPVRLVATADARKAWNAMVAWGASIAPHAPGVRTANRLERWTGWGPLGLLHALKGTIESLANLPRVGDFRHPDPHRLGPWLHGQPDWRRGLTYQNELAENLALLVATAPTPPWGPTPGERPALVLLGAELDPDGNMRAPRAVVRCDGKLYASTALDAATDCLRAPYGPLAFCGTSIVVSPQGHEADLRNPLDVRRTRRHLVQIPVGIPGISGHARIARIKELQKRLDRANVPSLASSPFVAGCHEEIPTPS